MSDTAKELLFDLISVDSSLVKGESGVAEVLRDYFTKYGIECSIDDWDGNRANFQALIKGEDSSSKLMFASHLDVVPASAEDWDTDPFRAVEKDGRVYGRGCVDMKGGMAAAAGAMVDLLEQGYKFKNDVLFVATAGEECDSVGAVRYVKANPELQGGISGVVVPEPTGMLPGIAHKGLVWLEVTFKGKSAHGSMPEEGVNAISHAVEFVRLCQKQNFADISDDFLGSCSLSVNRIAGGEATNIVPDECKVWLDIRYIHGMDYSKLQDMIKSVIEKCEESIADFSASIEVQRHSPSFYCSPDDDFIKTVCECLDGISPIKLNYTTDSPYFAEFGCPVVVLGPGASGMCHKANEHLLLDDFCKAKNVYKEIIQKW